MQRTRSDRPARRAIADQVAASPQRVARIVGENAEHQIDASGPRSNEWLRNGLAWQGPVDLCLGSALKQTAPRANLDFE